MRKLVLLLAAVLFVSLSAAAQESQIAALTEPASPSPAPQMGSMHTYPWQVAASYQFNRDQLPPGPWNPTGSDFNTSGYNLSVARYLGNLLGIEGQVGVGFGHTGNSTFPANLEAKSLFFGGGPRLALRTESRIEPWIHGLVGGVHYRFTQTAPSIGLGSNTTFAYEFGGGADFHIIPHIAVRAEADDVGTRLFQRNQANLQILGGVVVNF